MQFFHGTCIAGCRMNLPEKNLDEDLPDLRVRERSDGQRLWDFHRAGGIFCTIGIVLYDREDKQDLLLSF